MSLNRDTRITLIFFIILFFIGLIITLIILVLQNPNGNKQSVDAGYYPQFIADNPSYYITSITSSTLPTTINIPVISTDAVYGQVSFDVIPTAPISVTPDTLIIQLVFVRYIQV